MNKQHKKEREELDIKIAAATKTLDVLIRNAKSHSKRRQSAKTPFPSDEPVAKRGRPTLEVTQPGMRAAIIAIVEHDGAADPRRRTEALHAVQTLDELHRELLRLGYSLSRSGLYNQLIPHRPTSIEGMR